MSSLSQRSNASSTTLPFILDETTRIGNGCKPNPNKMPGHKSSFTVTVKVFRIGAMLVLLVFPLIRNFQSLLLLHQLQDDDNKEGLMNLPMLESSSRLGGKNDIAIAAFIHHNEYVSSEEITQEDQKQDGLHIAKTAAVHIHHNITDKNVSTEDRMEEQKTDGPSCKCVACEEDEVCGGLWVGNRYPGMISDEEAMNRKLHIVVSHCKTSVSWIPRYIEKFTNVASIHVISKCGHTVEGVPENTTTLVVRNVGRNDHAFAYYITSILPNLASPNDDSTVMFLKDTVEDPIHQGNHFIRSDFKSLVRVSSSVNGFACGLHTDGPISAYHDASSLFQFTMGSYNRTGVYKKYADDIPFESSYNNLGEFYNSLNATSSSPQIVQACYGGIFAASTANVFKQDMKVWKALEKSLERGDNIQEGHYTERLWGILLATPLESFQVEALREHSSGVRGYPHNGQLSNGLWRRKNKKRRVGRYGRRKGNTRVSTSGNRKPIF
eukprot:scaffold581_cov127-Skeletonema_marinoi.AAC.2